ncbi:MAG: PAS-domain containing protein [Methylobacterium sp.]|jgi:signal transduction histidine kinase|nr:PAS-domain containing protein [Methylobacterium sp.]MCA3598302.1 PAS-domain containing protein [Methylobacterium sp.]MCA3603447.1 PAS-domain containing protein [Methylobacterium sp.]MCA3606526.1 PAS-domain containing protein [Methylobacterium sp.]MCA3608441.1 PAS-domain containing protein [Methylobacterium sp.]
MSGVFARRLASAGPLLPALPGQALAIPDPATGLRLSGLSNGGLDLTSAAMALSFALMVVAIYATFISILHIRARKAWSDHAVEATRALHEAQGQATRLATFLAADRQVMVAWGGASGEPEIEGDPGVLLDANASSRVLAFSEWLAPEDAQNLERDAFRLRQEGHFFSTTLRTLRGERVEIEGRPVAGRAVMVMRQLRGESLQIAKLQDERRAIDRMFSQMRGMLDAIPQPAWLRDAAGRLLWMNAAYARAVDARNEAEVLERQVELLDSADRAAIREETERCGQFRGALTAVLAGERRRLDVVEVRGEQGGGGFALDITDLEAAREALGRQMDAHVRTLDELPTAVAMFDPRQQLTYSNKAFRDLFALDAAYLSTRPTNGEILDRLRLNGRLPEATDYKAWKAELLAQFANVESVTHAWALPNGRALRVVISPNPQGGVTYLFEDETERFTLAASYDRLKDAQWETLMALSEGVAVFGSDGCLQLSNPAFARLWHMQPEVLQGNPHIEEVARAGEAGLSRLWQEIAAQVCSLADARSEQQAEVVTAEGRTLIVTTTPLPDHATLVAASDVTDTVEAEKRLREHNQALEDAARLRTQFIRSVSFELRSPLQVVVGNAQALAGGVFGPLSERQQGYAQTLAQAADAVLALTDDILDLASVEERSIELALEPVDMAQAIQDAMEGLKDRLGEARVRVALNMANGLPAIIADPKRMTHILFNLIANAVSYSATGDTVRLAVRREGEKTLIEVSDSGRGPGLGDMAGQPGIERQNALRYSMARALVQLHRGSIAFGDDPRGGQVTIVALPDLGPVETQSGRRSA